MMIRSDDPFYRLPRESGGPGATVPSLALGPRFRGEDEVDG